MHGQTARQFDRKVYSVQSWQLVGIKINVTQEEPTCTILYNWFLLCLPGLPDFLQRDRRTCCCVTQKFKNKDRHKESRQPSKSEQARWGRVWNLNTEAILRHPYYRSLLATLTPIICDCVKSHLCLCYKTLFGFENHDFYFLAELYKPSKGKLLFFHPHSLKMLKSHLWKCSFSCISRFDLITSSFLHAADSPLITGMLSAVKCAVAKETDTMTPDWQSR